MLRKLFVEVVRSAVVAAAAIVLWTGVANAQGAIAQQGPVAPGHLGFFTGNGAMKDAGGPVVPGGAPQNSPFIGSLPNGIGFVNNGLTDCRWTGYATGSPYYQLCLGFDGTGNALLTVDPEAGATNKGFNVRLNGTTYPFPFSSGGIVGPNPTTAGDAVIWNNGVGTLTSDGGGPPLVRVADNTHLQALSTATASMVQRDDFAVGRGAPPLLYISSTVACDINAGAGDGGAEIPSANGKCWLALFKNTYNPQFWGADRTAVVDSTAAMQAAATWIGNNVPGARLDCGGWGNHYLIGTNAQVNTPLFSMTHSVDWYGCYFIAAPMTATTDIWSVSPTAADTDGWGWEYVTVFSPLNSALWRHTWHFDDAGNNQKFIRQLKFHDILVYPSTNRGGSDVDFEATDGGTGFLVQSTLGPNVGLFESFDCFHCGDSITLNGFTISTDGVVGINKTCINVSLATSGAGEFTTNDLNCQTYGGAKLAQMFGTHIRGGVFECQGTHLASANGAFLTITGSVDLDIDKVQFQSGGCTTPPGAINIDTASRNIEGRPIIFGTVGTGVTAAYVVAAAAFPTTLLETYGHHANQAYLQVYRNATNQTGIVSGTTTTVIFDQNLYDPTLAYNNGNGHFTPTVADGAYYAVANVCVNGTFASGALQVLITKNDVTTVAGPTQSETGSAITQCISAAGVVELNGSTDYLDVRVNASLSAGTAAVEGTQTSSLSIWRLAP